MIFATLLFRWERTGTLMSFVGAFVVWLVTIHLHPLAVFAAPLFLYPGLANRSWKQVIVGIITMLSAVVIGGVLGHISSHYYPEESERLIVPPEAKQTPLELLFQGDMRLPIIVAFVMAVAVLLIGSYRAERWKAALPATLMLALGAAACGMLHYHIGAIALLFGTILWLRAGLQGHARLLVIGAIVVVTALAQFYVLHESGEFRGRAIVGAFVGTPSIWPTLRFMGFSPAGVALLAVTLAYAAFQLARARRIPVHYLFFAIAAWSPLFAMGLIRWNVAERYTMGGLPFFLIAVVAGIMYLLKSTEWVSRLRQRPAAAATVATVLVAAIVNPSAAWQAAKNDYRDHPDHKGAAQFLQNLHRGPADIVIAEDSISQTYYLGKVDYRLQNFAGAKNHAVLRNGLLYDQYSKALIIGSGRRFEEVLDRAAGADVYVISSAQVSARTQRRNRENGIAEVLESGRLEVVYVGRDRETTVWKLRQPFKN
jgi:hypothetical protein